MKSFLQKKNLFCGKAQKQQDCSFSHTETECFAGTLHGQMKYTRDCVYILKSKNLCAKF